MSASKVEEAAEKFAHTGVPKPRERDGAVGRLVRGQFAHHAAFGAGMGEDVDEVDDQHVERMLFQRVEAGQQMVDGSRIVELVVGELIPCGAGASFDGR